MRKGFRNSKAREAVLAHRGRCKIRKTMEAEKGQEIHIRILPRFPILLGDIAMTPLPP
jgi:hypothetical protein